jgi:predicted kinase
MMVGVPGTGKSTLIKDLQKDMPFLKTVSSDEYIENIAKENNKSYNEVYQEAIDPAMKWLNKQIQDFIKGKQDFIWDQTNLVQSSRLKKLRNLNSNGYDVNAIVIELSEEEHLKRLNKRTNEGGKQISSKIILDMIASYQRPEYSEGFKSIILINDLGNALEIPKELKKPKF